MVDQQLQRDFEDLLGPRSVLVPPHDLSPFSQDASRIVHLPALVLQPRHASQVAEIVRLAHQHHLPLAVRGGGTGLDGGAVATQGGLLISLAKMNRIIEISPQDIVAVVQPGVITAHINAQLQPHGLFYPADPAGSNYGTIGGDVATAAHGLRSNKYGPIANYLLGLEVVISPGEIIRCGARTLKCATGYHLTDLFAGSRGRLGIITEVILKLLPSPSARTSLMGVLADVEGARRIKEALWAKGIQPSRMELMDAQAARDGLPSLEPDLSPGQVVLLLELDGPEMVVREDVKVTSRLVAQEGEKQARLAESPQEAGGWWGDRGALLLRLVGQENLALLMTAGIPGAKTAGFFKKMAAISGKPWRFRSIYGHLGEGRWHTLFLAPKGLPAAKGTLLQLIQTVRRAISSLGGRNLRSHAIGFAEEIPLGAAKDPGQERLWKALKERFDPEGLFSPLD